MYKTSLVCCLKEPFSSNTNNKETQKVLHFSQNQKNQLELNIDPNFDCNLPPLKHIFDDFIYNESQNTSKYETIVKPLLTEFVAGNNVNITVYGQKGIGKTTFLQHNEKGWMISLIRDLQSEHKITDKGLFFCSVAKITSKKVFDIIEKCIPKDKHFYGSCFKESYSMKDSYLETEHKSQSISESTRNVYNNSIFKSFKSVRINSINDMWEIFSATKACQKESKGHIIYSFRFTYSNPKNDTYGNKCFLTVSDLLGLEKMRRTVSLGNRELQCIDKCPSLTHLNNSIQDMSSFLQYNTEQKTIDLPTTSKKLRENTEIFDQIPETNIFPLTKFIKEKLFGSYFNVYLVFVSPEATCIDRTINSQKFAEGLSAIKTSKVKLNEMDIEKLLSEEFENCVNIQEASKSPRLSVRPTRNSNAKTSLNTIENELSQIKSEFKEQFNFETRFSAYSNNNKSSKNIPSNAPSTKNKLRKNLDKIKSDFFDDNTNENVLLFSKHKEEMQKITSIDECNIDFNKIGLISINNHVLNDSAVTQNEFKMANQSYVSNFSHLMNIESDKKSSMNLQNLNIFPENLEKKEIFIDKINSKSSMKKTKKDNKKPVIVMHEDTFKDFDLNFDQNNISDCDVSSIYQNPENKENFNRSNTNGLYASKNSKTNYFSSINCERIIENENEFNIKSTTSNSKKNSKRNSGKNRKNDPIASNKRVLVDNENINNDEDENYKTCQSYINSQNDDMRCSESNYVSFKDNNYISNFLNNNDVKNDGNLNRKLNFSLQKAIFKQEEQNIPIISDKENVLKEKICKKPDIEDKFFQNFVEDFGNKTYDDTENNLMQTDFGLNLKLDTFKTMDCNHTLELPLIEKYESENTELRANNVALKIELDSNVNHFEGVYEFLIQLLTRKNIKNTEIEKNTSILFEKLVSISPKFNFETSNNQKDSLKMIETLIKGYFTEKSQYEKNIKDYKDLKTEKNFQDIQQHNQNRQIQEKDTKLASHDEGHAKILSNLDQTISDLTQMLKEANQKNFNDKLFYEENYNILNENYKFLLKEHETQKVKFDNMEEKLKIEKSNHLSLKNTIQQNLEEFSINKLGKFFNFNKNRFGKTISIVTERKLLFKTAGK